MNCSICHEIVQEDYRYMTTCGHYFHHVCMLNRLTNGKNNCPNCKTIILKTRNYNISDIIEKFLRKNLYIFLILLAISLFVFYSIGEENNCSMLECYIRKDDKYCYLSLESKYTIVSEIEYENCRKYNDEIVKCDFDAESGSLTLDCGNGIKYFISVIISGFLFVLTGTSFVLDFFHKLFD